MPTKKKAAPAKKAKKKAVVKRSSTLMLVDIPINDQRILQQQAEKNKLFKNSKKLMAERVILQYTAKLDGRKLTLFK